MLIFFQLAVWDNRRCLSSRHLRTLSGATFMKGQGCNFQHKISGVKKWKWSVTAKRPSQNWSFLFGIFLKRKRGSRTSVWSYKSVCHRLHWKTFCWLNSFYKKNFVAPTTLFLFFFFKCLLFQQANVFGWLNFDKLCSFNKTSFKMRGLRLQPDRKSFLNLNLPLLGGLGRELPWNSYSI